MPIKTPKKELAITRIKASYRYSMITLFSVKPIDRNTPISFAYSYRFAVMEELNEKKQRNIVIAMITSNMISRIVST